MGFMGARRRLGAAVRVGPHRDGQNSSKSWICFLGDFEGGALCLEDGRVFNEKRQWFTLHGAEISHWNTPITSGRKYSVVCYTQRGAFKQ